MADALAAMLMLLIAQIVTLARMPQSEPRAATLLFVAGMCLTSWIAGATVSTLCFAVACPGVSDSEALPFVRGGMCAGWLLTMMALVHWTRR